jgi:hypothetical protein
MAHIVRNQNVKPMFRRIEFLQDHPHEQNWRGIYGIMGGGNLEVINAWIHIPKAPKNLNKNCRFFWTEQGWKNFGSNVINACKKTKTRFRIITIKEKSVDVFYRDENQVAVRVRKKNA